MHAREIWGVEEYEGAKQSPFSRCSNEFFAIVYNSEII